MTREQTYAAVLNYTHSWRVHGGASSEDLATARQWLALALLAEQSETRVVAPGFPAPDTIPANVSSEVELAVGAAVVELARIGPSLPSRVFLRDFPIRTRHEPSAQPSWAAGRALERSLGPFFDNRGFEVWVDLYEIGAHLAFARGESDQVLALVPIESAFLDQERLRLPAGSVWIHARAFHPLAPEGVVGLRITGGELRLDGPTHSSGPIRLDPQGSLTLSLELESAATATGPIGARVQGPTRVTLHLAPGGVDVIETDAISLEVDGQTFGFQRTSETAAWEPALGSLVIPLMSSVGHYNAEESTGRLFQIHGHAEVEGAGWVLPVTHGDVNALGEAAGAGALALRLGRGLTGSWSGLAGGEMRLNRTFIEVSGEQLAIVAPLAENRRARQDLLLWRETGGEKRSSVSAVFEKPCTLRLLSAADGVQAVSAQAAVSAHLDRPLHATGDRVRLQGASASVRLFQDATGRRAQCAVSSSAEASMVTRTAPHTPFALSNALLRTSEALVMTLAGALDADAAIEAGALRLAFGLHGVHPFLPDPYADNLDLRPIDLLSPPRAAVVAAVDWETALAARLEFSVLPLSGRSVLETLLPEPLPSRRTPDAESSALREIFDRSLGNAAPETTRLLDLSSNADQLGVGLGIRTSRLKLTPDLTVEELQLVAPVSHVRTLLLPQVQWEPVRTEPEPLPPFPKVLRSVDDGGSTLIGVESVRLVPVAPIPVVEALLEAHRSGYEGAVLFTLPFGIKAVARLAEERVQAEGEVFLAGPSLRLNRPDFGKWSGARQLSLQAGPNARPGESRFLPGAAVQTQNGVFPAGPPHRGSVLDIIETYFNGAFSPSAGSRPRVPVERIDFSGYGATCFSQWDDPKTQIGVSMVRFDVLRGRTAYEVVRVKSILWPCQAPVVREVTMERRGNAVVIRTDSGWVATGPGLFDAPNSQCVFHNGVVKGYYNLREIRDTRQFISPPGAELQTVYFDADIAVEHVTRGASSTGLDRHGEVVGFVTVQNQVGYVQRQPQGTVSQPQGVPLNPAQLAALIAQVGPIGGPMECEIDVGLSGQRMSVSRVYTTTVPTPSGPEFSVVVYGSFRLDQPGQWGFARVQRRGAGLAGTDEAEAQPIDERFGLPLIREGRPSLSRAANNAPYRFADPVDLARAMDPEADYGLLFSAEAYRVFFARLQIRAREKRLTSDVPPLLADPYALLRGTRLFPKARHCIQFPNTAFSLEIPSEGRLRLTPSPLKFTLPQRTLELLTYSGGRLALEYFDTQPTLRLATVELVIDPLNTPPHSLVLGPVGVLADVGPFPGLLRVVSRLEVHSPAAFVSPIVRYGSVLEPFGQFITVLQNFGLPNPLAIAMPFADEHNLALKIGLSVDIGDLLEQKDHAQGSTSAGKKRASVGPAKFGGGLKVGVELGLLKPECTAFVEMSGEVQQELLPLLYAGGFLQFRIQTGTEDPHEEIEFAMGTVGSLGDEFVHGFLTFEATVKYGYLFVITKEIKPGLIIGMEAKAAVLKSKLKGLVAITFEWEGKALIMPRLNAAHPEDSYIHVEAEIVVAVNIGLALFVEVGIELEGKFDQDIPSEAFAALGIALGLGILPLP